MFAAAGSEQHCRYRLAPLEMLAAGLSMAEQVPHRVAVCSLLVSMTLTAMHRTGKRRRAIR